MNKETADLLFETLDAVGKHTNRLNKLDKKLLDQSNQLPILVKDLEKQIETSTKDALLALIEKGNSDKEALVKDITEAIANSLAELTIGSDVSVKIETDAIAEVISKLPINNTNNIVVDTTQLDKNNKSFLDSLKAVNNSLLDNLGAIKVLFQEMIKKSDVKIPEVKAKDIPPITGMTVKYGDNNRIESVSFIRDIK